MTQTHQHERRTAILAGGFALAGAIVLCALFATQADPQPLWLWSVLAASFFVLQFGAVEVNDRLFVS